jgi:hypothetical protein
MGFGKISENNDTYESDLSRSLREAVEEMEKKFFVTVDGTNTGLIVGRDGLFLKENNNNNERQISFVEDLFKNELIDDWFHQFCNYQDTYLSICDGRVTRIPFHPSNPFHWHAFCGNLYVNIKNDALSNSREVGNSSSLKVYILDNGELKESCKKQFYEFIRREIVNLAFQM